jgi:copper ion binding protein
MSTTTHRRPVTTTYQVPGISCQHCVDALTHEIGQVCGVQHVDVDVERQQVTVTSAHPLDLEAVAAAVDEAGYQLGS